MESKSGYMPSMVLMPYEVYCEFRGEEPDPELIGHMVRITKGEARLVGDDTDTEDSP